MVTTQGKREVALARVFLDAIADSLAHSGDERHVFQVSVRVVCDAEVLKRRELRSLVSRCIEYPTVPQSISRLQTTRKRPSKHIPFRRLAPSTRDP